MLLGASCLADKLGRIRLYSLRSPSPSHCLHREPASEMSGLGLPVTILSRRFCGQPSAYAALRRDKWADISLLEAYGR